MAEGIRHALEEKPGSKANTVVCHGQLHYGGEKKVGSQRGGIYHG